MCSLWIFYNFSVVRLNTLCIKLRIISWWYRWRLQSASYFSQRAFVPLSEAGVFSASCCYRHCKFMSGKSTVSNTNAWTHTQVYIYIYIYICTYSPEHTEEVGDYQSCSYGISKLHQQSIDRAAPPAVCVMVTGRTHTLWNTVTTQTFTERRGERRGGEERRGQDERRGEERGGEERSLMWYSMTQGYEVRVGLWRD